MAAVEAQLLGTELERLASLQNILRQFTAL
jgi:hypothetical protein